MHVGRETSAQRECVSAGLFLRDTPLVSAISSSVQIPTNQFRPLDACFRFDQTTFLIERNHAIKRTRIDANAVRAELLATHRMTAAGNRNRQAFSRRRMYNLCKFVSRPRLQKFADTSAI